VFHKRDLEDTEPFQETNGDMDPSVSSGNNFGDDIINESLEIESNIFNVSKLIDPEKTIEAIRKAAARLIVNP